MHRHRNRSTIFRAGHGKAAKRRIWTYVLKSLAAHFGANEPVSLERTCIDPKVQWSKATNIRHNAGARSMLYTMAAPTLDARVKWIGPITPTVSEGKPKGLARPCASLATNGPPYAYRRVGVK